MSDHSELKRLAKRMKGWDKMSECWPCDENGPDWQVGRLDEDDNRWPLLTVDSEQYDQEQDAPMIAQYYAAANPSAVLELIAEVDQLKADLQGELIAAKEDAHRQRADQIAYRAAVYRLKREAPGEVVGGARLQRLFLISNDNAQILLSAMKERGDLFEIKEKPWGGMVPSTNSEILGDQP